MRHFFEGQRLANWKDRNSTARGVNLIPLASALIFDGDTTKTPALRRHEVAPNGIVLYWYYFATDKLSVEKAVTFIIHSEDSRITVVIDTFKEHIYPQNHYHLSDVEKMDISVFYDELVMHPDSPDYESTKLPIINKS